MRRIVTLTTALLLSLSLHAQASYLLEQIGRNEHQIIQSLGAFVGLEGAESQAFDITYMPAGNGTEGVMIINTADYRCTFKMDLHESECFEIQLVMRSADFLRDFNRLFQVYHTEGTEELRYVNFGNMVLRIAETTLPHARSRSFTITEK